MYSTVSPAICTYILLTTIVVYPSSVISKNMITLYMLQLRSFVFSLGFTITFGALFSKTWRVYRIFTNKKLLKRVIV